MVRAQPSMVERMEGVGVNALCLSDLEPEASALSWAGCGEPGERRLGLPSLPSGTSSDRTHQLRFTALPKRPCCCRELGS